MTPAATTEATVTRHETLALLLAYRDDALTAPSGGGRSDRPGSRLLLHDAHLWTGAYDQLEHTLSEMRRLGQQQHITYTRQGGPHDGATDTCSLRTARWHLLHWYSHVHYRLAPRRHRVKGRGHITRLEPIPVRHPDARQDRAQAGLDWAVNHYDWEAAQPGLRQLARTSAIPGLHLPVL